MSNSPETPVPAISPDPALKLLDRFVGSWTMEGNLIGSTEKNILGTTSYRWLPGGFFLEQRVQFDFAGWVEIDSTEIIGYDPATRTFPSLVYANMSPQPLPYVWQVDGDEVTITVTYGPMDATFKGSFSADGNRFHGAWRPNPGADEAVNIAYEIGGERVGAA
ncbi:DUF1579 family protein [Kribbella sandramycini]|uniref:DUF1579 family protein n=1 Tax=Kribbella sandramycini TaxID=60450 RepID=A0A7Y4L5X7_9ACTN|nr:DUF1579 family protein [Kribbella sandramycini]MBB6565950.1 hypothetical protein [Kribbella sandramycini]NOL44954.1 DUF1579 family protein [Kribbella sandramycini]